MIGVVIVGICVVFLLVLLIPGVSAETTCIEDVRGKLVCKTYRPSASRIGVVIGIVLCIITGMIVCLVLFVKHNRAEARRTAEDTSASTIEANQVQGPPVMRETHYKPASGPVGVYEDQYSPSEYSGGEAEKESKSAAVAVEPTFPRPAYHDPYYYSGSSGSHTAPATKVSFVAEDKVKPGASSNATSSLGVPQTAFMRREFPRPLWTSVPRQERPEYYK
ncbi:hypothetical protein D9756_010315 [Leucocoprinus leucothites]|uniref:Uncharacterized protein n=1 Tax=Leucocoprinus leucothites TaxID=201217 RepID=A0A8H5CUU8_9AGAR|nr:hypothetical protein D9756_010315 [Leucoagaricus leucothites]